MDALKLCLGDVVRTTGETPTYYVVRNVHHAMSKGMFRIVGYTLLETATLTDREVTFDEIQTQLEEEKMQPYYPKLARIVKWGKITSGPDWQPITKTGFEPHDSPD
jgi:hypothetical protein